MDTASEASGYSSAYTPDLSSDDSDFDLDDVTNIQLNIDRAAQWLCHLTEQRLDTVLWSFPDSLEGRIRLERKSQLESGLRLCYRELQVVLDALHAGCTLQDYAPAEGRTRSSEPITFEQRVRTLDTVLEFYLDESIDFVIMVDKSSKTSMQVKFNIERDWRTLKQKIEQSQRDPTEGTTNMSRKDEIQHLSEELGELWHKWQRAVHPFDDKSLYNEKSITASMMKGAYILEKMQRREARRESGIPKSAQDHNDNSGRRTQFKPATSTVQPEKEDIRVYPGPPRSEPPIRPREAPLSCRASQEEDIRGSPGPPRSSPSIQPREPSPSHYQDPASRPNATHTGTKNWKPEYRSKRPSRSHDTRPRSLLYDENPHDQFDRNSTQGRSSGTRFASTARQLRSSLRSWID